MSTLINDIKYALRQLCKKPGFTMVVVLVLGLGIGTTTAIFSVVHKVLWEPLSLPHAERMVGIWESNQEKGQARMWVSPPNFLDWQEQADVFDEIAAYKVSSVVLTGEGRPQRCKALAVTEGYFRLAGVTPELGRPFYAQDIQAGTDSVVLISHQLWRTRFGGDADWIGQSITLDEESYQLVGVMPENFVLSEGAQVWIPLQLGPQQQAPGMRGARILHVLARLHEDVSIVQAEQQMCGLATQIAETDPINQGWSVRVIGLHDQMVASVRLSLLALLGGAGFLLLTACANVTNLLVTRMTRRQQELAIQQALGATRLGLLHQVLMENLVLALLGGLLGIFIACWGIGLVTTLSPWDVPRLDQVGMSVLTLSFGMGLSLLVGLVCGLLSVGGIFSRDLGRHLKGQGRRTIGTTGRERLRRALVVTETAFSVILLVATGLMVRSFWSLRGVDPGFTPENIQTMTVSLPTTRYPQSHQQSAFFKQLLSRAQNLPGVTNAALVTNLPLAGTVMTFGYQTFDQQATIMNEQNFAQYHAISPDYFQTLGIQLLHGRAFTPTDRADGAPVVIVNAALAEKLWSTTDVVGRRIGLANEGMRAREVVGVVSSVKHKGLDAEIGPEAYVPFEQNPWNFMTLVARSHTDTQSFAGALRQQLWALDPDLPADSIVSLEHLIHNALAPMRFRTLLVGLFGAAAVLLAAVGLYAMVSYTTSQRTQEFGIRMALGAQSSQVLRLVLAQGIKLCVTGVTVGLASAWALTRIIRSLLYDISPTDLVVFVSVALMLSAVALLACALPALRASKIDPMEALRYE